MDARWIDSKSLKERNQSTETSELILQGFSPQDAYDLINMCVLTINNKELPPDMRDFARKLNRQLRKYAVLQAENGRLRRLNNVAL